MVLSQNITGDAPFGALHPVLRRRELFLWLGCILLVNQLLSDTIDASIPQQIEAHRASRLVHGLFSRSVFYYLGWYAVFSLLVASNPKSAATTIDIAVAVSTALLNLVSALATNWLAATAAALFLLVRSREDVKLRAAAVVLLALTLNGFWGPKLFNVFAYPLLRLDAALVGSLLALTQPGMDWNATIVGQPSGHSILIFGPCSSFHNISLALLCWVSITKLLRTPWTRGDFLVALLLCTVVFLFNASRLYLMALSHDNYVYWHEGPGEQIAAWTMTISVFLISLWGAVKLGR